VSLVGTVADVDAELVALLASAGLPTEDVHEAGRVFLRFVDPSDRVVGIGGYEPLGDAVLLRSIVIAPERRGQGFGKHIAEELMRRAAGRGARRAYALTTGPETFLTTLSFERIERTSAPISVLETRQARGLCAASAVLWRKEIGE
jgi:N-acetylglutamate synthase-like GNAT family acetyltransferase